MADEEPEMPEVARRKGAKDTLFSADWYDDADDFGGVDKNKSDDAPAAAAPPVTASQPASSASTEASEGGSNTLLIVGVLIVGIGLGGGLVLLAGGVAAYLYLTMGV